MDFLCKIFPVYVCGNFTKQNMEQFLVGEDKYAIKNNFNIDAINSIYNESVSNELKRICLYWVKHYYLNNNTN